MAKFRVVLDYGHGGSKPGAAVGGVMEKTVNLSLGDKVYQQLHAQAPPEHRIQVLLTRDTDYDIPLSARYGLINRHHEAEPINVVVSLHHNAARSPQPNGFEAYYAAISLDGRAYAEAVVQSIKQGGFVIRGDGTFTTQQLGRRLAMIHKTAPPAVLLEAGYLTNPVDRANAADPAYRQKQAESIAAGIWSEFKKRQP